MDNKFFAAPDVARDKELLDKDKERRSRGNAFRAKVGENVFRILPARVDAPKGITYYVRGYKHFMRHGDEWETFTCNQETYEIPCPVCELRNALYKEKRKTEAKSQGMMPATIGVFNIIDRLNENAGVQLYEAPYTVWYNIIYFISSGGAFSDLVYKQPVQGEVDQMLGRDILLIYNKDATPQLKYGVHPSSLSPLGTLEQIKIWFEQITHLEVERFFPPIDYDEAKIRAFGSIEERRALMHAKEIEQNQLVTETTPVAKITPLGIQSTPTPVPTPVSTPINVDPNSAALEAIRRRIEALKLSAGKK